MPIAAAPFRARLRESWCQGHRSLMGQIRTWRGVPTQTVRLRAFYKSSPYSCPRPTLQKLNVQTPKHSRKVNVLTNWRSRTLATRANSASSEKHLDFADRQSANAYPRWRTSASRRSAFFPRTQLIPPIRDTGLSQTAYLLASRARPTLLHRGPARSLSRAFFIICLSRASK
jgi:hypothetical protein